MALPWAPDGDDGDEDPIWEQMADDAAGLEKRGLSKDCAWLVCALDVMTGVLAEILMRLPSKDD